MAEEPSVNRKHWILRRPTWSDWGNPGGLLANRLPTLDGARGLAALLVFGRHFCTLTIPWTPDHGAVHHLFGLLDRGALGVDLLFLLSGYLIYGSLIENPQSFDRYLGRRLRRIYPTFITVFLVYLVLMWVFPERSKIPQPFWPTGAWYLLANLALLPGVIPIPPVMVVAWSLSYEWISYLAWPVFIETLRLRSWRRLGRILLLAVATAAFLQWGASQPEQPLIKFSLLLAGGLLWEVSQSPMAPRLPGWGLIALLAVAPLSHWLLMTWEVRVVQRWILLCLFLLLYDLVKTPASLTGRLLSNRWLRHFGLVSYSFYLIHSLVLHAIFLVWNRWGGTDGSMFSLTSYVALMVGACLASLMAAQVLFSLVERPFSFPRREGATAPRENSTAVS
jgi:exopolysaccharide production protein ExoZ